nr:immunoglobulin heavy chain junction region [Mus musculus]
CGLLLCKNGLLG